MQEKSVVSWGNRFGGKLKAYRLGIQTRPASDRTTNLPSQTSNYQTAAIAHSSKVEIPCKNDSISMKSFKPLNYSYRWYILAATTVIK